MADEAIVEELKNVNKNLIKLMAVVSASGKKPDQQLSALSAAGFSSSEIERITGIPSRTVRGKLSEARKRR